MALVADLPAHYNPWDDLSRSAKPPRRLIIIGDVHGQLSALQALLHKTHHDSTTDHVILVGDLVTKGPESVGVVQLAIDLGASAVRGNHEDKVLRLPITNNTTAAVEATASTASNPNPGDHTAVARALSPAQRAWLSSLPLILRIPTSPTTTTAPAPWNAAELIVVHAGLVPGVPLAKQDPWAVMNMRSLVYDHHHHHHHHHKTNNDTSSAPPSPKPIDGREGEPWSEAWNRAQNAIPREEDRVVVIYGHDAHAGPQTDLHVRVKAAGEDTDDTGDEEDDGDEDNESDSITDEIASNEKKKKGGGNHHDEEKKKKKKDKKEKKKKKKKDKKKNKKTGIRYAFGLDSGCGHGRQLTALVLEANRHRIVQVECEKSLVC
ncbi:Metallo-dependent phosphatase-like protein [Cercophora scortea]|uniref:Metallo-dependent phosphatase-like protein n=1 Tax=Cercophora scortea TaxID=314031 RepID=A0AAE0J2E3_9PEZI|nr:Metallo-dependent phosphatase-like protein [Cercophora scortea]